MKEVTTRMLNVIFCLLVLFCRVKGRPSGAPVCPADQSAPGAPPRNTGFFEGTIAQGNLTITIDGEPLVPDVPVDLETGKLYQVVVQTTTFFRGFLARLAGGDEDINTTPIFQIFEDETDLQFSDPCLSLGVSLNARAIRAVSLRKILIRSRRLFVFSSQVGGVTHRDRNNKTSITFFLEFDQPSNSMALDVNVVQSNPSPSVFYYSQYIINVAQGQPNTLLDVAVKNSLVIADLAAIAGLNDTLRDTNVRTTLFAPINIAFFALPPRVGDYFRENPDILAFVLLGHAVEMQLSSSSLVALDGQEVGFLNNVSQSISVTDEGNIFVGSAQVVGRDFLATNGVIHLLDSILGVPTFEEFLVGNAPEYDTLLKALVAVRAPLGSLFDIALFAPTNAAFEEFRSGFPGIAEALLEDPSWVAHLQRLLLAHVLDSTVFSSDLGDGQAIVMLTEDNFTVGVGDGVTIRPSAGSTGTASIIEADMVTKQGAFHGIDEVLLPLFFGTSIVDLVSGNLPTLADLVVTAGLDGLLADTFGITGKCLLNQAI